MLHPNETELVGQWIQQGTSVISDGTCTRIKSLIGSYLVKVAGSGWESLFQDPNDLRYWELTYLQSYMHGGGPPSLQFLSNENAIAKYGVRPNP